MNNTCNFSTGHYIQTLKNYQKTHDFCFFNNSADNDVILRHDVDFSLEDALRIAKIENSLGIPIEYSLIIGVVIAFVAFYFILK